MPFQKKAKIVIENQNDVPYGQYFYIDYELYREPLAGAAGLFSCPLAPGKSVPRLGARPASE